MLGCPMFMLGCPTFMLGCPMFMPLAEYWSPENIKKK